jgi:alpha-L-fucosidase
MKEIGEWMQVNGEAIYGTRPIYPFTYGKFRFTQKGDKVYGIFLLDKQESPVPDTYWFDGKGMSLKTGRIKVLGSKKKASLCREADGRYRIDFPNSFEMPHAVVFEMRQK